MSAVEPVDPRVRLAIAQWPPDAPRGSVTTFCAEHSISRKTFYEIRKRALQEGQAAALEPRSRRPRASPSRLSDAVKLQAIGVRAALESSGLDHRRFVYPAPNACWQLDATEYVLTGGRTCVIFQLIDDHSRYAVASHVAWGETSKDAIAVVSKAIRAHGVPQRLLSDNGAALNPSRRGMLGQLVAHVTALGVEPITGKPGKPTTQGPDHPARAHDRRDPSRDHPPQRHDQSPRDLVQRLQPAPRARGLRHLRTRSAHGLRHPRHAHHRTPLARTRRPVRRKRQTRGPRKTL
jgi:putative transposase